jgi:hypothetical protein
MAAYIFVFWFCSPNYGHGCGGDAPMAFMQYLSYKHHWDDLFYLLMIAFFGGIYIVPLYTIMQSRCKPAYRSRTVATNNIMNALFMVLGSLIAMAMLKAGLSSMEIFLAVGLLNLPIAFLLKKHLFV